LPDACIDRLFLKAASGQRVAYYNLGMAWPAHKNEIDAIYVERDAGTFPDSQAFAAAEIGWLLTDSSCDTDWNEQIAEQPGAALRRAAAADYVDADGQTVTITLWEVAGR
jgi:hypothetical protein